LQILLCIDRGCVSTAPSVRCLQFVSSLVLLSLADLQEHKARNGETEQHKSDNSFRVHGLCLHSALSADDHHDTDSSTGNEKQDTTAKRGELPPIAVHTELDELVVFDRHGVRIGIAHFLRHSQLLRGDREVAVRGDALFHPNITERNAVHRDLTVAVNHEIGDVSIGIDEVAAVIQRTELQSLKVVFALDLDTEARAHQRIAGRCVNLQNLDPGRAVLYADNLRIAYSVMVGQRNDDLFLGDIAVRSNLDQPVFSLRQITELHMTVLIHIERIAAVLCPNAVFIVVGDDNGLDGKRSLHLCFRAAGCDNGTDDLIILIDELELNVGERSAGEQVNLVDLQTDWFIGDLGRTGHVAVVVHGEGEGLIIDRVAVRRDGFLVSIGASGQLIQDDLAVQVGLTLKDDVAVLIFNLDDRIRNGLAGRQVGLLQDNVVCGIVAFKDNRVLVVGGDVHLNDFI